MHCVAVVSGLLTNLLPLVRFQPHLVRPKLILGIETPVRVLLEQREVLRTRVDVVPHLLTTGVFEPAARAASTTHKDV